MPNPERCTHGTTSAHIDIESRYFTEILYKEEDRPDMMREVYNKIVNNDKNTVFNTELINRFIHNKHQINEDPDMIFITIDPSFGGSSLVGLIAFAIVQGKHLVIIFFYFLIFILEDLFLCF